MPNKSAAAPSTGWTMAKVNANIDANPAAAAMLTLKSLATCGSTGSSARADRLAANVASAMIFRTGGIRGSSWPQPRSAASTRYTLFEILGECIERHQRLHQTFELAQRHHVGAVRRRTIGVGMVPLPPGCCTEWVASKITGAPVVRAMIGNARMSDTSVL